MAFVLLALLSWNPIYTTIVALVAGSMASVIAGRAFRMRRSSAAALFFGFYALFMVGLVWFAPGYIEQV